MPVTRSSRGRGSAELLRLAMLVACLLLIAGAADVVLAQANPFGGPRPPSAAPPQALGGVIGWITERQNEFYRSFSKAIHAAKEDGTAVWGLLLVSFLYGVFHAVLAGHGKAVISSYLVANNETWRRGVALSFTSAMLQAVVAVGIVAVVRVLLGWGAQRICETEKYIEAGSYALIAAFGAYLVWVKGRGFFGTLRAVRREPLPAPVGAAVTSEPGHRHDHHHDHHGHEHEHVHDDHCGHSHGPDPKDLAGPGGWRRGLGAIVSVGLRPCSGAIIVLVVALSQDLFWAGIVAAFVMALGTAITVASIATFTVLAKGLAVRLAGARAGFGTLAMRGVELGAALLVVMLGVMLFLGYVYGYSTGERLVLAC